MADDSAFFGDPSIMEQAAKARAQQLADGLLAHSTAEYPFIKQHNPAITMGTGDGYAETWPVGETGTADVPRPAALPADRLGISIYRPDAFGPSDLAGEVMHVDPYANEVRGQLQSSFSPAQIERLKSASGDYGMSTRMGMSDAAALQNAMDSAMRGYVVGQWPDSANASMGYNPDQLNLLNALKAYVKTGHR